MRIRYISYGVHETGGSRHEKFLFDQAVEFYAQTQTVKPEQIRKNKYFQTPLAHLELLIWSFFKSQAELNIVTAKTALMAVLRNWFNQKKVWIVMHNFNENDWSSPRLSWYYKTLFKLLRKKNDNKFKVIVVAPYWSHYFKQTLQLPNVHLFPNFFKTNWYQSYCNEPKTKLIHLGQWSSKNDPAIFKLAEHLSQKGWQCYFTTLQPKQTQLSSAHYQIKYFEHFKDYIDAMAKSEYTLALSGIAEGWNRIAHESLLVCTTVIGYNKGGLGDLLKESKSYIVNSTEEAIQLIETNQKACASSEFIHKYDLSQAEKYMIKLCMD